MTRETYPSENSFASSLPLVPDHLATHKPPGRNDNHTFLPVIKGRRGQQKQICHDGWSSGESLLTLTSPNPRQLNLGWGP